MGDMLDLNYLIFRNSSPPSPAGIGFKLEQEIELQHQQDPSSKRKFVDEGYRDDVVVQVTRDEVGANTTLVVQELKNYNIEVNEYFKLPEESRSGREMYFSLEIPHPVNEIKASLRNFQVRKLKTGILLNITYSGIGNWFIGILKAEACSGSYYLKIKYSGLAFTFPKIKFKSSWESINPSFCLFKEYDNRLYWFSSFLNCITPPVVKYNEKEIPYEYSSTFFRETPLYVSIEIPKPNSFYQNSFRFSF
ncbi:hypothetical protein DICPUDRAFT_80453 [Dictyostelium purpureum]|uniref:Uncharacterized protein n=1 Tax=Dictyostelium purpureum TaxID=5786 RepID=F0ZQI8_DICPU|nr:uncharacterized protein DICPUDRAFT_80453 [Dictyostelium purpureum]EGC33812.1 hypothetical protein DICPUDRAFT_80453 [Dictyostelium purpureum]|eukprot:XP_003289683.1 hypothetical protein DICPUDRAFT_80453 [Dictyostelium purpureum]